MPPMHATSTRRARILGVVIAAAMAVSAFGAVGAQAARGGKKGERSVTHMRFKLDDHEVTAGDMVTGTVKVFSGKNRTPLADTWLNVWVDGEETGEALTGEDGTAVVSVFAEEGEHVVKVRFEGYSTYRPAQRAQGFVAVAPVVEEVPLSE